MKQNLPGILVIDDELAVQELLCLLFEEAGYQVWAARDGQEGLALLRANLENVCLVLLDMMMPGMNGRQFLTVQRNDPTLANIPVIALSAGKDVNGYGLSFEVPFVKKPFDVNHLLDLAERVMAPPELVFELGGTASRPAMRG